MKKSPDQEGCPDSLSFCFYCRVFCCRTFCCRGLYKRLPTRFVLSAPILADSFTITDDAAVVGITVDSSASSVRDVTEVTEMNTFVSIRDMRAWCRAIPNS